MDTQHRADPTPDEFLTEIAEATPGWSENYGGPHGVIALCGLLQQRIAEQSEAIAAVRVAAIRELLRDHTGVEVAASLGVSSAAISKTMKADAWEDAQW